MDGGHGVEVAQVSRDTERESSLLKMQSIPVGACTKVVGAYIQPDGGHDLEYREVGGGAWAAFHSKRAPMGRRAPARHGSHL